MHNTTVSPNEGTGPDGDRDQAAIIRVTADFVRAMLSGEPTGHDYMVAFLDRFYAEWEGLR